MAAQPVGMRKSSRTCTTKEFYGKTSFTLRLDAMSIAKRGSMDLHQADCHLEYARLYLAQNEEEHDIKIKQENREKAQEHWTTAKEMIERMGYHRRDKDVQEIEAQLAQAS